MLGPGRRARISRVGCGTKFLPPQLYNSIFATTRVAAKRKKLTIFFSDIANFTETTDRLESEELTNLLNQYLTEMSKPIFAR